MPKGKWNLRGTKISCCALCLPLETSLNLGKGNDAYIPRALLSLESLNLRIASVLLQDFCKAWKVARIVRAFM